MPRSRRGVVTLIALAALFAVPALSLAAGQPFYIDLFTRIMVFAIAALSLDLILGYGGMVSFGHAAYLGIGAYAVGILSFHGIGNGFIHFGVAILASALVVAGDRLRLAAHQRRPFHHDHAGLRADALFPRREPQSLWRR